MEIHTGIDILDIPKFAENLNNKAFIRKVFTTTEIADCETAENPTKCYAGKFAAKEAFMKALGAGIRQEVWFTQIEVLGITEASDTLSILVKGKAKQIFLENGGKRITANISHSNEVVVAMVMYES